MALALLSLGSNIDPAAKLRAAAADLHAAFPGARFSPVLRYRAVGFDGPDFLNAAAAVETALEPGPMHDFLHALEDARGRRRDAPRYSSRTLDVDLVFLGARVCDAPRLPRPDVRHAFVLEPLAMLAPQFVDPLSGRTLAALWAEHADHARPAPVEPWAL